MTDFEIFSGLDQVDGAISAEAMEKFKERMRKNRAQLQALQKSEQRQKDKEDKLARILSKFIKKSFKKHLILLVVRCLEQNIPAPFLLTIILLGNEEIQKEAGIKLELPPGISLEAGEEGKKEYLAEVEESEVKHQLIALGKDKTLPLKIRVALDLWGKNIFEAASSHPPKILKTVLDHEKNLKNTVIQLAAFVLRDFFAQQKVEEKFENLRSFAEISLKSIIKRLEEQVENQKELTPGV